MESPTNRMPTLPSLALRSLRNPSCRLRNPLFGSLASPLTAGWSAASFLAGGLAARVVGLVAGAAVVSLGVSFAGASSLAQAAGDRAGVSTHAARADRTRNLDHLPGAPDGRTVSVDSIVTPLVG